MQRDSDNGHPIDQLGTALMRATGLLSALAACQDQSKGTFVVPEAFLLQAISALEGFVNDARNAYFDICARQGGLQQSEPQAEAPVYARRQRIAEPDDDAMFRDPDLVAAGFLPGFQELRERKGTVQVAQQQDDRQGTEEFAPSYEALMRKLTAAEVFATEQNMAEPDINSPLLPLLKSLRQDLERLRAA